MFDLSLILTYKSQLMTATKKSPARNQAEVIEALGGAAAFRSRFGLCRTAPYNYISGVRFPDLLLCRVIAACAESRIPLSTDVTGRIPNDVLVGIANYVKQHKLDD